MRILLFGHVNNNNFIRMNAWQFTFECRANISNNITNFVSALSCCALAISLLILMSPSLFAADEVARIKIGYISQQDEAPPNLSNLDVAPANEGVAGGEISIRDNNTTGRFMNQEFTLATAVLSESDDPVLAMENLAAKGVKFFVLDVAGDAVLKLADKAAGRDILFFNSTATDNRLRQQDCRGSVMHIVPSRAMYADALAQFLVKKRWRKWFLVTGTLERDQLFAQSIKQSARKFGGKIVEEKQWAFGPDARRTAQAEVPGVHPGY